MLHEIILSLFGFPGSLFKKTSPTTYTVIKDLPFIHPSETAILEKFGKLISHHQTILRFIKTHTPSITNPNPPDGIYLKAVCRGLDAALEPYRTLLIEIKEEIIKDPKITICYIQKCLQEYHLLFPALVNLINDLENGSNYGCAVLDVVYKHKASGITCVKKSLGILMNACHEVMFKQLSAWLFYGVLVDPHREFFIQKREENGSRDEELMMSGEYYLQPSLLPVYVAVSLAEKACFVGESVRLLERKESRSSDRRSAMMQICVVPNKEAFAERLAKLQKEEEFSLQRFECVINDLRACVAEQLWKLVVEEKDLVGHLHVAKDFFLLGRGELFQAFIEQAGDLLDRQVNSYLEHNVNAAFQVAMRAVSLEDESSSEKFMLVVSSKEASANHAELPAKADSSEIGWHNLSLRYNVPWPLHTVFTKNILEKYNTVFRFLMYVKRVQLDLQSCWTLQMQWKAKKDESFPLAWKLRNLMSFLVNNLQYYLQVDVLESQHSLLLEKIQNTHDFEAIKHAHEQFVISLMTQTFLSSKSTSNCIMEIMKLCLAFCQQFLSAAAVPEVSQQKLATDFTANVLEIEKRFKLLAGLLFQILTSSQTYQSSPFVAQLLMRLDYNQYFSSELVL